MVFTKLKKSIFHFSSQKDLQILLLPFFGKAHGFYFNQKNVVKNKKLWFPTKQYKIRKNVIFLKN